MVDCFFLDGASKPSLTDLYHQNAMTKGIVIAGREGSA